MPKNDNPFADEELSQDELAALEQETDWDELPDADDEDPDKAPASKEKAPDTDPDADAEADPDKEAEQQDGDDDWRAFMEKHKGKSPEELAKLAWQQNQARKEARHNGRQAQDQLAALVDKISKGRAEREKSAEQRRADFEKELQNDPDAATKKLHEDMLAREQQQAQQQEWDTYITEQRRMTREAIPDFDDVAPEIMRHAVEDLGYTPQEVQAAADYRELVMANQSRMFNALVSQGVVDKSGNLIGGQAPSGASDTIARAQAANQKEAPRSMSDARGTRTGSGKNSLIKQAEEMLAQDDLGVDDDTLDNLLKELG